jgi:orotate phosphoribosyltransferase
MPTDNKTALLHLIATLSFKLGDFTLASGKKSDYYIDCRITTLHAEGGRLSGLVLYDLIREHIPDAEAVGGLTMGADPLVSNTASASAWALATRKYQKTHENTRTEMDRETGEIRTYVFKTVVETREQVENDINQMTLEQARKLAPEIEVGGELRFYKDHNETLELSSELDLEAGTEFPPTLIHGFLVRKSEKTHGTGRKIEGFLKPGARVVIVDDVCTTGGSTITAIEAAREAGMTVAGVLCLVDREQGGREKIEAACHGAPFLSVFTATEVRAAHVAAGIAKK